MTRLSLGFSDDVSTLPYKSINKMGLTEDVVDPLLRLCRAELRVKNLAYSVARSVRIPARRRR